MDSVYLRAGLPTSICLVLAVTRGAAGSSANTGTDTLSRWTEGLWGGVKVWVGREGRSPLVNNDSIYSRTQPPLILFFLPTSSIPPFSLFSHLYLQLSLSVPLLWMSSMFHDFRHFRSYQMDFQVFLKVTFIFPFQCLAQFTILLPLWPVITPRLLPVQVAASNWPQHKGPLVCVCVSCVSVCLMCQRVSMHQELHLRHVCSSTSC